MARAVDGLPPRQRPVIEPKCRLSGLEPFNIGDRDLFVNVGERTNVTGSRAFARLILAGDYPTALDVARQQVANGAQVIDINMDEGMRDAHAAMVRFLNLIAADAGRADLCRTRGAATVITPHPAEAARLLGTSTEAVQSARIAAVRQLASRLNAVALLKGCGTLVAGPDGFFTVNPTGHPGLAQAGQGDTLTGMIAALLAQGLSAGQAARHGAWLHGQTAGSIVAQSARR